MGGKHTVGLYLEKSESKFVKTDFWAVPSNITVPFGAKKHTPSKVASWHFHIGTGRSPHHLPRVSIEGRMPSARGGFEAPIRHHAGATTLLNRLYRCNLSGALKSPVRGFLQILNNYN